MPLGGGFEGAVGERRGGGVRRVAGGEFQFEIEAIGEVRAENGAFEAAEEISGCERHGWSSKPRDCKLFA